MASTAFDQDGRDVLKLDELAFGAVLALEQRGHQLRLQLVSLQVLIAISSFRNRSDFAIAEANHRRLRAVERLRTGNNLDAVGEELVVSDGRVGTLAFFAVSRAAQVSGDLLSIQLLAHRNRLRPSIDFGRIAEYASGHTAIHQALVFDIEIRKGAHDDDAGDEESGEEELHHGIMGGEMTNSCRSGRGTHLALRRATGDWPAIRYF